MRERGVQATSFSEVLAHSGAPRGSIYHHFPGGKAQLIEEATRYAGEFTAAGFAAALADDDPTAAIHRFTGMWLRILERSDFGAGCPVVAAALEGGSRETAGAAFAQWESLLAEATLAPEGRAGARTIDRDDRDRRDRGRDRALPGAAVNRAAGACRRRARAAADRRAEGLIARSSAGRIAGGHR